MSFESRAARAMVALLCMLPSAGLAAEAGRIMVFTSILPQEYFVERIGGDRVEVEALVRPGSSPATYEPTPRQMVVLSEAKIFFRIGVQFENAFVPKLERAAEGLRIVDTRLGITLRMMKAHHHHDHDHDHHHDHDHDHHHHGGHEEADHQHEGGADPHVWLSPRLVEIQARTIADALIELDPAGEAAYEENLVAFLEDLDALDRRLADALAPVRGKTFMVFHPAWGYFADAYGLEQEPIEIEGKDPSGRQIARMIEMAEEEGVRVIFVQPQFSQESAKSIAEAIGGAVLPIDPLARDYVGNLERVAAAVREALQKQD
ncbi:MAG: zinc ABC transporter substrate-binding protein [Acidobacteriota bacterium]